MCHAQAEAREAGRKFLESERLLAETRAEEQATRARHGSAKGPPVEWQATPEVRACPHPDIRILCSGLMLALP